MIQFTETEQKINKILHKLSIEFEEKTIKEKSFEELGMDSLDKVELEIECETEFNIEISFDDGDKINSYEKLVNYINNKIKNTN